MGRWVFAARDAMAKSLRRITEDSPLVAVLNVLGRVAVVRLAHWLVVIILSTYWKLFLRATNLLSRRQEFRADELASIIAGGSELGNGLRRIEGAAEVLPVFWKEEMSPAIGAGLRPPFAEGFVKRLHAPATAAAVAQHVEMQLKNPSQSAYDTHPPLRDRLAAVAGYPAKNHPDSQQTAQVLLEDVDVLEAELIQLLLPQVRVAQLRAVSWEEMGDQLYVKHWQSMLNQYGGLVDGWTVADLPSVVDRIPEMVQKIPDPPGTLLTREQRQQRIGGFIAQVLALALIRAGWKLHAGPGEFHLSQGDQVLDPQAIIANMTSNAKERFGWPDQARALGIESLPLVPHTTP
jgi:hypothetical protein